MAISVTSLEDIDDDCKKKIVPGVACRLVSCSDYEYTIVGGYPYVMNVKTRTFVLPVGTRLLVVGVDPRRFHR